MKKFTVDEQYFGHFTCNYDVTICVTILKITPHMIKAKNVSSGKIVWRKLHNSDYFASNTEWFTYCQGMTISAKNKLTTTI